MEEFNTYYNQTAHNIKSYYESWTDKIYLDSITYHFVYNYVMNFYVQAVNKLETLWDYWKQSTINPREEHLWQSSNISRFFITGLLNRIDFFNNLSKCYFNGLRDSCYKITGKHATESIHQDHSSLSIITREISSQVPISDSNTRDKASSTSLSSYPSQKIFDEMTANTKSSRWFGFDTMAPKSHEDMTTSSTKPAVIIQNNVTNTESMFSYEPLANLYESGLNFLFPPEKMTQCAISVTSPDKQQRLINFSDRLKNEWIKTNKLLESSGEIKCIQISTGERDYTSFVRTYI